MTGAIAGGLIASVVWTLATVCASRSSRLIGAPAAVGWVMVVGLVLCLPLLAISGPPDLSFEKLFLLALGGICNLGGLLLIYAAMRTGDVSIAASIVSTEGAVGAVIAVLGGESLSTGVGAALAAVVAGVLLAAAGEEGEHPLRRSDRIRAVRLAVAAALVLGVGLYATGRVSAEVPLAWVLVPARLAGVLALAIPLALRGRLRLSPEAVPWVLAGGTAEMLGVLFFGLAARQSIAIAAVLGSQVAALSSIAAYLFLGERIRRSQILGIALIVTGVSALGLIGT